MQINFQLYFKYSKAYNWVESQIEPENKIKYKRVHK